MIHVSMVLSNRTLRLLPNSFSYSNIVSFKTDYTWSSLQVHVHLDRQLRTVLMVKLSTTDTRIGLCKWLKKTNFAVIVLSVGVICHAGNRITCITEELPAYRCIQNPTLPTGRVHKDPFWRLSNFYTKICYIYLKLNFNNWLPWGRGGEKRLYDVSFNIDETVLWSLPRLQSKSELTFKTVNIDTLERI